MSEPIYTKQHMEVMRDEWKKENEILKDTLLQVQDHMSQLSTHCDDGWAISCADNVVNMIELKLEGIKK